MSEEPRRYSPPPVGRRSLIDRPEQVAGTVERLLAEPVLGVDVEAGIPPRERHSRFALLQIAVPGDTYAIDPLRLRDLSPFAPIFASERVLKVFHGIALDRDMLEGAGLVVRNVTDLSDLARSAYGRGEASLAALSRRAFGIGMDKSLQRSDWLHRPLTLPLLAYAWRDAELTLGLYYWAAAEHPDLLALHTSISPRPVIPGGYSRWITTILEGSRQSAFDLLAQDGLDIDRDGEAVASTMRAALVEVRDPALRVRLFRAVGELDVYEVADVLAASLRAPSAHERASAARTLAALGELSAEAAIRDLLEDPTEEVRQMAEQALRVLPERALELTAGGEAAP
jgi:hypothetical protein